jgi:hypothetical protein
MLMNQSTQRKKQKQISDLIRSNLALLQAFAIQRDQAVRLQCALVVFVGSYVAV